MTKQTFIALTLGILIGALSVYFLTERQLTFAWSQYQVCADELSYTRTKADDAAKEKLHQWAKDKVVIDSNKLAEAIIQTSAQFDAWYYKSGNVAP